MRRGLAQTSWTGNPPENRRTQPGNGSCYIPDRRCQPMGSLPEPLITISPEYLGGEPVFTRTRVPVQALFDYIEAGDSLHQLLDDFPNVTRGHAIAVLEMARRAAIAQAAAESVA